MDAFPPEDCGAGPGPQWRNHNHAVHFGKQCQPATSHSLGVEFCPETVFPVTIQGRALLRELTADMSDWDTPLTEEKLHKWEMGGDTRDCGVFSDASTKAIDALAYLRAKHDVGQMGMSFVMGKAKLALLSEPTLPRLELCAAVLDVEIAELIQDELDLKPDATKLYCDSKVVLGYIYNKTK